MSTRYVWDIYNVKSKGTGGTEQTSSVFSQTVSLDTSKNYVAVALTGYTISDEGFVPTGASIVSLSQLLNGLSVQSYPYLAFVGVNDFPDIPAYFTKIYMATPDSTYPNRTVWCCRASSSSSSTGTLIVTDSNYISQITSGNIGQYATNQFTVLTVKYTSIVYSKGDTKTGNASSSSSSTYPRDDKSGDGWYIYLGADNIDPQGVIYDKDTIERGDTINVTVLPTETNEFGGTISYQYQVSGDGGSTWSNEGPLENSTNKNFLIAPNATQFSVRVQAQDSWGFVSNTYVKGLNLNVSLTVGDYVLFAGGQNNPYIYDVVDAYNSSLTHSTPEPLSQARYYLSGASVGDYALFGGGFLTKVVDSYNKSLTHGIPDEFSSTLSNSASTTIGNFALFAGGYSSLTSSSSSNLVFAYNQSLSKINATTLNFGRKNLSAVSIGNYALIAGGDYSNSGSSSPSNIVDSYNKSLSHDVATELSVARYMLSATTAGNYALIAGGRTGNSVSDVSSVVEAYDENLTQTIVTELSTPRYNLAATRLGSYAIFGGGMGENGDVGTVDVYDSTLTRTINTDLSLARSDLSAGTIGVYALFAGGNMNGAQDIVDVYLHI